jgi:hypothetical protein
MISLAPGLPFPDDVLELLGDIGIIVQLHKRAQNQANHGRFLFLYFQYGVVTPPNERRSGISEVLARFNLARAAAGPILACPPGPATGQFVH